METTIDSHVFVAMQTFQIPFLQRLVPMLTATRFGRKHFFFGYNGQLETRMPNSAMFSALLKWHKEIWRGPSKHHSCKFGSNWPNNFRAEDWNVKLLQTMDGLRTPSDGKSSCDLLGQVSYKCGRVKSINGPQNLLIL